MSVFISYSHQDAEIVEKIASYLVKENVHVWIDKWELNYGDSLIQKVQDAITDSSVLLIMLSKASVESEWCRKELSAGLIRELEEKRVVTIPILLETCNIPLFLKDKYHADFRSDFESAVRKLQDSLLKNIDITLNKIQTNDFTIDWGINYYLENGQYHLSIDSVSFSKKTEHSILCIINIVGNEYVVKQYNKAIDQNSEHLFVNEIIQLLFELDKSNDFRIIISDNIPQTIHFELKDDDNLKSFKLHFYIRRMGINNGFDILFDYGSIIRLINQQREIILSK